MWNLSARPMSDKGWATSRNRWVREVAMLQGNWARVMGLAGASSLAALLLMVALVGLAQAQEEKPPPVANLKCEARTDQVRFSWDIPEWSGGEIKYYDLVVTLPNGNRFIQRNHWMLRSRTDRGNWQPGREARISVKALYDVPGGERVTSEANELACVVPGTPNSAPVVSSAIADATIVSESGTHQVALTGVFSDADGDALTVTASSSDESVATVSVSADYSKLTVSAKSRGTATITVTAADGNGGTVEDAFTATVKSAPVVASGIADVSGLEVEATQDVSMSGVFSDADGDAVTVTASSSDEGKATVAVAADGSKLTLTGVAEGTATVTVAAEDIDGNRVSDAFDVAVVEAEEALPPNSAPTVASAIADATIVNESGAKDVSLSGVFSDADGDDLAITASSSAETVATVSVSADYSTLTVAAKSRGTATITVTAADGNGGTVEDAFTATVKSAPVVASGIADVSELEIDATHQVSLSGVFSDADGDALTVTEASSSDSAVAAVLVAIDGATSAITGITVIGKDEGTATITVTARDSDGNGVSDAFDVTVPEAVQLQRTLSSDATLNGLSLSGYTLNGDPIPAFGLRPAFASGTTEYAASAPQFTARVRVTATATDPGAAIQVDGQTVASGAPSQLIQLLDNRPKRITVTVTAADGATRKTYAVMATSNPRADLRALSMSPGELWPRVFSNSDKTYSAWLPYSVESVRVTATGRHGGETLTVNGKAVSSGQPSPDIALDVGENLITVVATAPDGYTSSSYTIAATRLTEAQSSDATLSAIKVYKATSFQPDSANNVPYEGDPLTIAPAISRTEREYQAEQPEGDGIYVAVVVETNAPGARSIVIDGPDVNLERRDPKDEVVSGEASGPWQMAIGYQLITISVTSPDGKNTETYRLVIKRGTVDDLKGLRLSSGDGSLTVSWDAGASPTAPTHYMLRWRKAGETTWLNRGFPAGWKTSYALDAPEAGPADGDRYMPVSQGSATLSGLENGVAYEVQARGARGSLSPRTGEWKVFVFLRTDWQSLTGTPGAAKTTLTITPSSPSRQYGGADDLGYTVSGLKSGDVATDVLTGALSRATGEDAGDYAINLGTLAVASAYAGKYSLPAAPSVTTYTITPKPITAVSGVTVTSRAADGTTDATFDTSAASGTGVLAAELADFRAGGLQVSGAFPSADPGAHDVSLTYSLRDQGSFKAANYSISATSATLRGEITAKAAELPGPVTGLELSATFDSVTVSWSAPASGDAPQGYIAHLRPEGGSEGSGRIRRPGADKTTATFDNLESSRTYRVWVRAQNEAGKGERVHASITLPAELPGPVTGLALTATEGAADSVTVSWQAPETGGAPDGYIAHLRLTGGAEGSGRTKTPKASKTQVTFGNLESGTTYKVWVRAENEAGKGERVQAEITLLTITPLTITPSSPTRVYGATDDLAYSVGGLLDGDVASEVVTGTLSRTSGDDTGDYAIGMGTLAVESAYAGKYSLPAAPSVTTYTITPRPVTAISGVTVASRAADGTTDATFDTGSAQGTGVLPAELADFRAGGLQVSGAFPSTAAGAHDVRVTYSLQDHGSFKAANYALSTTTATLRGELTAEATAVAAEDLMLPPCTPSPEATSEPRAGVIAFVMCDDDLTIESIITPSNITLIPAFSPDRHNYTVVVADEIERIKVMGRFKTQRHRNPLENPGYAIAFAAGESTEALRRSAAWPALAYVLSANNDSPQKTPDARTVNLSPGVTTITVGALKWVTNWGCRSYGPVGLACNPENWGEKVTINGYKLHLVWRSPDTPVGAPEDPKPVRRVDYDTDDNGLIEISSPAQLDAVRWDSNGDGYSDHGGALARGFPNALRGMGCPAAGCKGYELAADLDLDTNGNGRADAGDDYWNKGHGWLPIGTDTDPFRAIFEGNGHTIRNLHISSTMNTQMSARRFTVHALTPTAVGLFQQLAQGGIIRNVGLEDADVSRSFECLYSYADVYPHPRNQELLCRRGPVGGLVGVNHGVISGSYVTGAVSNELTKAKYLMKHEWIVAGGLVGVNSFSGVIAGSYGSARVSGRMTLNGDKLNGSRVGGLVGGLAGNNQGSIIASYAAGDASMAGDRRIHVGGLAGMSTGSVTASYAFGEVSGIGPYVGGLVGQVGKNGSITDGYWDTHTSGKEDGAAGIGKTTAELQTPTAYAGIYADWNVDLDGDGSPDDPWDFGTSGEYPMLKHGGMDTSVQRSLQLPDTPGRVQDLRLRVSVNNAITVTWREPRSGGAPNKYAVQLRDVDGGDSRTEEIAASRRSNAGQLTFLFDNMKSGATYEVGVQPVNRAGSGTWTRDRLTVPDATVLSGLTISPGSLNFASDTLSYHVTVREGVKSVTLTPIPFNSQSIVTVDGNDPSAAVALQPGNNVIDVVVASPDGAATRTYTVSVLRKIPGKPGPVQNVRVAANWREDRSNYGIEIRWDEPASGGTPGDYYVYWNNDQNSWASSGLTHGGERLYTHHSSGGSIANIVVKVRATNNYGNGPFTTIRFAVPSPAALGGLAISDGHLAFFPDTTMYTVPVSSEVDSVTLTPYVLHDQASVTVNGEDPATPLKLTYGDNVVNVVVTAADGTTTKTYVVNVVRLGLASVQLTDLTISTGSLNFDAATIAYTVNVPHTVDSVTLTVAAFHPDATVTVDGEDPASAVSLDYGKNVIAVVVTAPGGVATQTYTVTMNRPLPQKPGPPVNSQVEASTDTITITWQEPTSGGEPSHYIARLRDADGSTEDLRLDANARRAAFDGLDAGATYTVSVRAGNDGGDSDWVETRITLPEVTDLADLTISDGSLTFDRATTSYTVNVGHSVSSVTLTTAVFHPKATVTVDGGDPTAAVSLNYGANVIAVVVTAPDGATTQTYKVTVNRARPLRPGPPQNARVESSADAITVTWQPPNSGGSPSRYVARLRDAYGETEELRLDADARRAVFDGLEAGATYTVGVRAANDGGESDWAESEITLPLPAALSSLIVIRQRLGLGTVAGTNLISDPAVTEYEIELSNDDLYLTLRPTAKRPGTSTITVNGSAVASGGTVNVPRPGRGKTKVESIVVREGDVERIYTLTVKRGG